MKIPLQVLNEYNRWRLSGATYMEKENWQYDDGDLQRISSIMSLHNIGLTDDNIEKYMELLVKGMSTANERMAILEQQRSSTLAEIHQKEQQIIHMDYMRDRLRNNCKK